MKARPTRSVHSGEPGRRESAWSETPEGGPVRRVAAAIAVVALLAAPATAQEKSYELGLYDVDVAVGEDGSYDVTERIAFRFSGGDFTTAFREVPLARVDSLVGVEVTSPAVEVSDVRVEREGGELVVRWAFPPSRGRVPFRVRYRAHGALQEEGDRNVVHWAAVGAGWEVPVDSVRVDVTLPAPFLAARDSLAAEPADDVRVASDGGRWRASFAHGRLEPGTTYAVRLSVPKVMEARETGREGRIFLYTCLALLVGMVPGLWLTWRWRGPESDVDAGSARHSAPDLPLARAAVLLTAESVGSHDDRLFAALITDLAQRGHLRIERYEEDALIGSRKRVRARPAGEGDVSAGTAGEGAGAPEEGATGLERELLDRLARHESLQSFRKEEKEFRERAVERVRSELVEAGLLRDRSERSDRTKAWALLLGAAAFAAFVAGAFTGAAPVWEAGGLLLGAALGGGVAAARDAEVTGAGARARARVRGSLDLWTEEIEEAADGGNAERKEAARRLVGRLPWLVLERGFAPEVASELDDELDEEDARLLRPDWLRDLTGEDDASWTAAHAAAAASASTTPAGGAGAGAAGAGAAGAAGGGGGGAA